VTLELFNHKRQSGGLATHPPGVVTQITFTQRSRCGGLVRMAC